MMSIGKQFPSLCLHQDLRCPFSFLISRGGEIGESDLVVPVQVYKPQTFLDSLVRITSCTGVSLKGKAEYGRILCCRGKEWQVSSTSCCIWRVPKVFGILTFWVSERILWQLRCAWIVIVIIWRPSGHPTDSACCTPGLWPTQSSVLYFSLSCRLAL